MSSSLFPTEHPEGLVDEAHAIVRAAIQEYRPVAVYGLFSGGHDSLCAVHVASQHDEFSGCVHINTGIGIEATRQYVRDVCAAQGWPLREMHPPPFRPAREKRRPGVDYDNWPPYKACIAHYGFPGPAGHTLVYNRLKERCLRRLVRETKRTSKDRVLLVGGMRREESTRRMGTAQAMSREGCRCWCAPLLNWDHEQKRYYMAANQLLENPVVKQLCMSGECLCGAFARRGELAEVRAVCPRAYQQILDLEKTAAACGVHAVWGTRPPEPPPDEGELPLFSLCWSCEARWDK